MLDRDRPIAAMTAYCEADAQPPVVRRWIIHCMFNRMRLNPIRYGSTVAAVCLKRAQFSEWNGDVVNNRNLERAASSPGTDLILLDCAAAYDEIEGGAPDPTGGGTHFYDESIPKPYWTDKATFCGKQGTTMFWKGVP